MVRAKDRQGLAADPAAVRRRISAAIFRSSATVITRCGIKPTSLDRAGGDLVTTLRIKVKRDGSVLGSEIVKASGNSLMDGSVLAAAEQVKKIDALPDGLGKEDIVDIPINFKLDQGQ